MNLVSELALAFNNENTNQESLIGASRVHYYTMI